MANNFRRVETLQNSYSLSHFILSVSERRKSVNVLKLCTPSHHISTFICGKYILFLKLLNSYLYIGLLLSLANSRKQECCVMSIDNDQEGGRTVRTGIKETDYGVLLINLYHNSLLLT